MEITGPNTPPAAPALQLSSPQSIIDTWKIGQLVNASVTSGKLDTQVIINVAGKPLLAQTQLPLQPGQILQLEVTRLATLAMLKLIDPAKPSAASTITLPSQSQIIPQWQKGQTLNAILSNADGKGEARINFSGQQFDVRLLQAVPINQPLKLEILNPGTLAALRILNLPQINEPLGQAIRLSLPQQAPLAPLLNNISAISQNTVRLNQEPLPLPSAIVDIARNIVEKIPTSKTLATADGVQQAINQSGIFLEAKILQLLHQAPVNTSPSTPNLGGDFKGGLLSLLASLFTLGKTAAQPLSTFLSGTNTQISQELQLLIKQAQKHPQQASRLQANLQQLVTELIRSVESGLARIQLNQFSSSNVEDDGKRLWSLDIPVRHNENIDIFQLRIEKDAENSKQKQTSPWTINLAFELQSLGPIQVCVTLKSGIINAVFWVEHKETIELINKHINILTQGMINAGINVGNISTYHGKSPEPITDIPAIPQVLLDVKV